MEGRLFHRGPSRQELLDAIGTQQRQIEGLRQMLQEQALQIRQELCQSVQREAKDLRETMDARIWQAEENTGKRLEELSESLDARIWQSEEGTGKRLEELNKSLDARIWKVECFLDERIGEMHRHVDFTYRDIMVALQRQKAFLPEHDIILETNYPVAYHSMDHLHPHGTIQDNTRCPRFVEKCESLLCARRNLAFLDLGCSGGGMVLEAALRGHISMGLEGSDCSKTEQRAEWRLLGNRLQTCDITKPFSLRNSAQQIQQFDIITAWEVLEHIAEADLPQLFENIKKHLTKKGYFVGSIANYDDIDPESGVNWHVTVHPYDWWEQKFMEADFQICTEDFSPYDMARGTYNSPQCYLKPQSIQNSFHFAVKKR